MKSGTLPDVPQIMGSHRKCPTVAVTIIIEYSMPASTSFCVQRYGIFRYVVWDYPHFNTILTFDREDYPILSSMMSVISSSSQS